jgi:hypothetical protein
MNTITLFFHATGCNGQPMAKISLNGTVLHNVVFAEGITQIQVPVLGNTGNCVLAVERYGKQRNNMIVNNGNIVQDQILEITQVHVDNVKIPEFYLSTNSTFVFNDQTHVGSRYFGPNGVWSLGFSTPLITHLLDAKILHESKYSQDYEYPWSYRLGPNTVEFLLGEMDKVEQRVHQVL